MKNAFSILVSSLTLAATPARAQEEAEAADANQDEIFEFQTVEEEEAEALERELSEAFGLFGELFPTEPLTEEQTARLPFARKMANHMLPEGTFGAAMQQIFDPMFVTIVDSITEDTRTELARQTSVPIEDLDELDDQAVEDALNILDPQFAERNERLVEVLLSSFSGVFDAMEPAYRDALAHVLTVRFREAEMIDLLVFFETPLGSKFARESFSVQYDPQMMRAIESMGPAMADLFPAMVEDLERIEEEFLPSRNFTELSSAERGQLSQLLGMGEAELDALAPVIEETVTEDGEPVV